jgi:hypothetical protein
MKFPRWRFITFFLNLAIAVIGPYESLSKAAGDRCQTKRATGWSVEMLRHPSPVKPFAELEKMNNEWDGMPPNTSPHGTTDLCTMNVVARQE